MQETLGAAFSGLRCLPTCAKNKKPTASCQHGHRSSRLLFSVLAALLFLFFFPFSFFSDSLKLPQLFVEVERALSIALGVHSANAPSPAWVADPQHAG